jgi:hypothetical protein
MLRRTAARIWLIDFVAPRGRLRDPRVAPVPVPEPRPVVFQRRDGFSGRWIPVLDEWRPEPGLLCDPSCVVDRHGRLAIYVAFARDTGERVGPAIKRTGGAFS